MANGQRNDILLHLHRAALPVDGTGLADGELLEHYLTGRDEAAFESLLLRHGPMVLGVCRRVLRNEDDAHDAFQATFLVFVRKAASIVPRAHVANWLYGVARKTALKAKALNDRRRIKEKEAVVPTPPDKVMADLLARLDEALSRLPDKYRAPIVLCDLEERSLKEAAQCLGCPPGTVASRLARARAMLARRLVRCGLSLGGGALTTALAQAAPVQAPSSWMSETVHAASHVAASPAAAAGVTSPMVTALMEGVLRDMWIAKWKTLMAAMLAVGLLLGGALLAYPRLMADPKGAGQKDEKPKSDKEALQGTWVARSAARNGETFDAERLKNWERLIFKDDRVSREGRQPDEGTYTLYPDKKPKEIDLLESGDGGWEGIYELKGTTLKMALRCGEERPTQFDPKDSLVIVYERKKE